MSQYLFRLVGCVSLLYTSTTVMASNPAIAQVPLTGGNVESLRNIVEWIPRIGDKRPARLTDRLGTGEAIRTAPASRVDLRFNDGSFARIGEQATFGFVPYTRTFRLANGTALFLIPPDQGPTTIETPSAVANTQGTALVVRHVAPPHQNEQLSGQLDFDAAGEERFSRTVVLALTDNDGESVQVSLLDDRTVELAAGQMAIVDRGEIYLFEFDLALFYQTSSLVNGLNLDNPDYLGSGYPTDSVRQETLAGLSNQSGFVGEYFLNPTFFSAADLATATVPNWLFPLAQPQQVENLSATDVPLPSSPPMNTVTPGVLVPPENEIPEGQVMPDP